MKKKIITIFVVVIAIVLLKMTILRKYKNVIYKYTYVTDYNLGDGIELIEIYNSYIKEIKFGLFTNSYHHNKVNEVNFTIQKPHEPINKYSDFVITSVVISNVENNDIKIKDIKRSFSNNWVINLDGNFITDEFIDSLDIYYDLDYGYPNSNFGYVRSNNKEIGSFYYKLYLGRTIDYPSEFDIVINYQVNDKAGVIKIYAEPYEIKQGLSKTYLERFVKRY